MRADITFSHPEFHKRETSLLGRRNATRRDFETVLKAMRSGLVPVAALASHRDGLSKGPPNLVPTWSTPESEVIKEFVEL